MTKRGASDLGERKLFPARPTVYKGIQMRSRLEARWAAELDAWGVEWLYEPRAYADENGQYLPDFEVHNEGKTFFVEVKPTETAAEAAPSRIAPLFSSLPKALVWVIWPIAGPDEWGTFFVWRDRVARFAP